MGSIQQATEQQGFRQRADRRPTQGQVIDVDRITHTCTVDIKRVDTQGTPVYMENLAYQPQSPPSPGDTVTIGYTNSSPHSAIVIGSQLSGQNGQDSLTVVGGVSSIKVPADAKGTKGDLTLTPGTGITITRSGGNFTIDSTAGGALPSTTAPADVASADAIGTDTTHYALADHAHEGVHSLGISGGGGFVGDVKLHAGSNITLTPVSDGIQIDASGGGGGPTPATTVEDVGATGAVGTSTDYARADHVHQGVHSIHGTTTVEGDIVFNGSGVSQAGNTFTFSGTSGMNLSWDSRFDARVTGGTLLNPIPNGLSVPNLSEAVVFTLNNGGGNLSFELPSSAAYPIMFKMCDTFTATIHAYHTGAGTIDGASSYTLVGNNKVVCLMPVGIRSGVVDWIILWTY